MANQKALKGFNESNLQHPSVSSLTYEMLRPRGVKVQQEEKEDQLQSENEEENGTKKGSYAVSSAALGIHGGRIARSIGRRDRHSKVYTSKGPRDRRLRLSAPTAIDFFDVQDRLGYDRPSKAIDWLMEKAKAAIEALAADSRSRNHDAQQTDQRLGEHCLNLQHHSESETMVMGLNSGYDCQNIPGIQTQDLRLSLQSFQEPVLDPDHVSEISFAEQAVNYSGFGLSDFNGATDTEFGWFQRMISWNSGAGDHEGEEFGLNSKPQTPPQPLLCQNQLLSQGGPLQSSNLLSVCAWSNQPIAINCHDHHKSAFSSLEFASGRFSLSQIPARIQDKELEHNAIPDY